MRSTGWLKRHRLQAFFILTYAISWASWPAYASGLIPRMEFLPIGPLAAAIIVIALTEGRAGFRAWGRRLIRWRVGWIWYAVAILLPVLLVLASGVITMVLGAAAPGLAQLTWSGMLTVFAVRLVNPLDGPLGEEPGFRGYALPLLQTSRSPLVSAAILGVLVALWHLPLVLFGGLSVTGLPTTFAITFLYVWLFNRTDGSVLLTLLFHNSQGTFTMGSFGFTGADAARVELVYFMVVVLAVLGTIALDRQAWQKAPRRATAVAAFPSGSVPCERRRQGSRRASGALASGEGAAVNPIHVRREMTSPLAKAAGPIALVSGIVFAAVDVARLLAADRSLDRIEMMRQVPFQVTNALYWVVFIGLVLALVSVYFRLGGRAGALGAVAFCFALAGTLDMAGNMWFDGFAGPWIADVAPGAILAGGSGMLAIGGLSSYVLFALGWMVFGIAGWRSRMFPAWIGVLFVVAGVLGYNAGLPPYGIPIGLVVATLGWWVIRSGAPAAHPATSNVSRQPSRPPET